MIENRLLAKAQEPRKASHVPRVQTLEWPFRHGAASKGMLPRCPAEMIWSSPPNHEGRPARSDRMNTND